MSGKDIVSRLFDEVLNGGRLDSLGELLALEYVDHNPVKGLPAGVGGMRLKLRLLRQAFPDLRFTLDEVVEEGETVAARYHWEGTHRGEFLGLPPSGRSVCVAGMDFYRLREGRLAEHWHTADELGLLRQIGVIP
ncbi:MAG: ester cyclase [Acidobacteriota bacterium]